MGFTTFISMMADKIGEAFGPSSSNTSSNHSEQASQPHLEQQLPQALPKANSIFDTQQQLQQPMKQYHRKLPPLLSPLPSKHQHAAVPPGLICIDCDDDSAYCFQNTSSKAAISPFNSSRNSSTDSLVISEGEEDDSLGQVVAVTMGGFSYEVLEQAHGLLSAAIQILSKANYMLGQQYVGPVPAAAAGAPLAAGRLSGSGRVSGLSATHPGSVSGSGGGRRMRRVPSVHAQQQAAAAAAAAASHKKVEMASFVSLLSAAQQKYEQANRLVLGGLPNIVLFAAMGSKGKQAHDTDNVTVVVKGPAQMMATYQQVRANLKAELSDLWFVAA